MNFKSSAIFIVLVSISYSCTKLVDTPNTIDCSKLSSSENTYTKSIKSIMDASCATSGCHTANSRAGNISLHNYVSTKNIFVNGKGLCSIKHTCNPMPIGSPKLSSATIEIIDCWVKSGAPE